MKSKNRAKNYLCIKLYNAIHERTKLTKGQVARQCKISLPAFYRIMRGDTMPSLENMNRLLGFYCLVIHKDHFNVIIPTGK